MPRSTHSELTALRLRSQGIDRRAGLDSVAGVVRYMLAMQAQDLPGAKWSIGLRLPGATDAAIETAIARGEIVRSWLLRGTLHLVAPEDLGWMLALSRPRQANQAAKRRLELGIADRDLARAGELAQSALAGNRMLRRDEMLALFEAHGIPTDSQRGYHLLWNLGREGIIVFGPADGAQQRFALLSEWVTRSRTLDGDEALAELAGRYFRSHGPATERDFAWWASLTLSDARTGIALAQLERREIESVTHYLGPDVEPAARGIHALPGFDEYLLGYQDRSAALAEEYSQRIVPGNNGVFQPTIVVDGRVVGTWRRRETARLVRVEVTLYEPVTARATKGIATALERYSRFIGKPVEWEGA